MALICSGLAQGAGLSPDQEQALRIEITEQTKRLEILRQQLVEADAKLLEIRQALGVDTLRTTRGGTNLLATSNDSVAYQLAQASPALQSGTVEKDASPSKDHIQLLKSNASSGDDPDESSTRKATSKAHYR